MAEKKISPMQPAAKADKVSSTTAATRVTKKRSLKKRTMKKVG